MRQNSRMIQPRIIDDSQTARKAFSSCMSSCKCRVSMISGKHQIKVLPSRWVVGYQNNYYFKTDSRSPRNSIRGVIVWPPSQTASLKVSFGIGIKVQSEKRKACRTDSAEESKRWRRVFDWPGSIVSRGCRSWRWDWIRSGETIVTCAPFQRSEFGNYHE